MSWRVRPSSPTAASGFNIPLQPKAKPNTLPCAGPRSRWRRCTGTRADQQNTLDREEGKAENREPGFGEPTRDGFWGTGQIFLACFHRVRGEWLIATAFPVVFSGRFLRCHGRKICAMGPIKLKTCKWNAFAPCSRRGRFTAGFGRVLAAKNREAKNLSGGFHEQ